MRPLASALKDFLSDSWGPQGVLWGPSWCGGAQDSAQPMKVLLQSSSNLAGMGRHLLARPEWKNSREGGGVTAASTISLVQSTLMCIPEPASKAKLIFAFGFQQPELARSQLLISIR